MTYIEIPLWLAICFLVCIGFVIIHLTFGDFAAKVLYKIIKQEEEKKEKELKIEQNEEEKEKNNGSINKQTIIIKNKKR